MSTPTHSPLAHLTAARVALGRAGVSEPTGSVLAFALDAARARDAVVRPADFAGLDAALSDHGLTTLSVDSAAPDRLTYLARPDLGRRLSAESLARLAAAPGPASDLVIVAADGLSSRALDHVPALIDALAAHIAQRRWSIGPIVMAGQARVALGDEIGERMKAKMVLVLVGERPGLSSPDSLGAYLTHTPRVGRTDAERNCVSNIRPAGLPPAQAAAKLAWLMDEAFRIGQTGVSLKDESPSEQMISVTPPPAAIPDVHISPARG